MRPAARHDGRTPLIAAIDGAARGGSFAALASPVLNAAGVVAFAAVVEGGPTPGGWRGVFLIADGGIGSVALLGDALSLAFDGSLAFIAAIDGGPGITGFMPAGRTASSAWPARAT